jgi:hypothetical protein
MPKFQFRFQAVLQHREMIVQREQAQLQKLIAAEQAARAALSQLLQADIAARTQLFEDLQMSIDPFLGVLHHQQHQAGFRIHQAASKVAEQRRILQEAERNVKLLERLRNSDHQLWQLSEQKQLESVAADLFTARWTSMRTPDK